MSFILLAAEPSMLMALLTNYCLPLVMIFTTFTILCMLYKLCIKFSNKLDAETVFNTQEVVNSIIAQGASLAERWANNVKKDMNTPVSSGEKMLKATAFVSEELRRRKFSNIEEKEIKDKIEAYLGIGDMNTAGMFPTDFVVPTSNPEEDGNEDFYGPTN